LGGLEGEGAVCFVGAFDGFGEAEVEDFDLAVGGEEDVGGFEVSMDDALVVGGFEGFGDLEGDVGYFGWREGAVEGLAIDEFHDDGVLFEAEDGGDIGVVDGGEGLGFALEAGEVFGIEGEGFGEDLDGDFAIEFTVAGFVDFAHAAGAYLGQDFVVADLRSGR
jgi:hypothetical protein